MFHLFPVRDQIHLTWVGLNTLGSSGHVTQTGKSQNQVIDLSQFPFLEMQRTPAYFIEIRPDGNIHNKRPSMALALLHIDVSGCLWRWTPVTSSSDIREHVHR